MNIHTSVTLCPKDPSCQQPLKFFFSPHACQCPIYFLLPHSFSSPLVGVLSFPYILAFYKRGWRQQSDHELTKVNRMRTVLMNHLDDLHDIWEACSHMPARVTQEQFSRHLRRELPEMRLSRDVEEFLFEQVKSTQAATS